MRSIVNTNVIIVVDMVNDFIYDEYEYEGKTYKGKLVASQGPKIVEPIKKLLDVAYKSFPTGGMDRIWKVGKDHFNALDDGADILCTLDTMGAKNVYLVGLVDEVCIFQNAMGLLKEGFNVHVVIGHTVPFVEEKGTEAFMKMSVAGVKFVMAREVPDIDYVLFLEDEHDENTVEISDEPDFVDTFPEHCIRGTPGSFTVEPIAAPIMVITKRS